MTTLDSIANIAGSGLAAAQAGISVISDNVANASVTGYTSKTQQVTAFETGNISQGVRTAEITRSVNQAVQNSLNAANASVSALTVRSQVLQAVNQVLGSPDSGNGLTDELTNLQNSFTTLQSEPSSVSAQDSVVSAAQSLAGGINTVANTITVQENRVQSQIVSVVSNVNSALSTVQTTTAEIMAAQTAGTSTADLEDQRDTALSTLSQDMGITATETANGDVTLLGQNGLAIPLDARLTTSAATLSASSTSTPAIMLQFGNSSSSATDITSQITGGSLGELINLRDDTLPVYQAQIDQFSQQLASRMSQQGLTLFTDGSGNVPSGSPSSYAGFSSDIQVNSAVVATPSLVRDGTPNNNTAGVAGYSTVISNVLNYSFGTTSGSSGTANAPFATNGLGPNGNLSSTLSGTNTLSGYLQAFVTGQSSDTSQAGTDLTNATAYQTTVQSQMSSDSSVDVDQQMGLMIQLQNSYQANARILQTTESLYNALWTAVS